MINPRAFWVYLTQLSVIIFMGILGFWLIPHVWIKVVFFTILFIVWLYFAKVYLNRITLVKRHKNKEDD